MGAQPSSASTGAISCRDKVRDGPLIAIGSILRTTSQSTFALPPSLCQRTICLCAVSVRSLRIFVRAHLFHIVQDKGLPAEHVALVKFDAGHERLLDAERIIHRGDVAIVVARAFKMPALGPFRSERHRLPTEARLPQGAMAPWMPPPPYGISVDTGASLVRESNAQLLKLCDDHRGAEAAAEEPPAVATARSTASILIEPVLAAELLASPVVVLTSDAPTAASFPKTLVLSAASAESHAFSAVSLPPETPVEDTLWYTGM